MNRSCGAVRGGGCSPIALVATRGPYPCLGARWTTLCAFVVLVNDCMLRDAVSHRSFFLPKERPSHSVGRVEKGGGLVGYVSMMGLTTALLLCFV